MKTFFTLFSISLLVFLFTPTNNAQVFEWAESMRGKITGRSIVVDASGNSYITGDFIDTVKFGIIKLYSSSTSGFIAKYDAYGNCIWAKRLNTTMGNGISVDNSGNLYVVGNSVYICKFSNSGDLLWERYVGGSSSYGYGIASVPNCDFYITGSFTNSITFGTTQLSSAGSNDIFIAKYDSSGNVLWAKKAGSTLSDIGYSISVDNSGNIYLAGIYGGSGYVWKYDISGNQIWARSLGISTTYVLGISSDANGNSVITGYFSGTVTFGTIPLTSSGYQDIFVAKYDNSGNCIWAKKAGGGTDNDRGQGCTVDLLGNCYITGYFRGTAYFDNISLGGSTFPNIFVAKYDNNGNCLWVKKVSNSSIYVYSGYGITDDSKGNIFLTGYGSSWFGTFNVAGNGFITKLISTDTYIKVKNNTVDSLTLQFGLKYLATDGINIALGENSLPPLPPSNVFDARFELPIAPVDYSLSDFRSDDLLQATWTIKIQAGDGGYPVTLTWDSSALGVGNFTLKDGIIGTIVNVNMKNQSQYVVTNSALTIFKIEYTKNITAASSIQLNSGWNIVSVPLQSDDMSKTFLFPNATSNLYGFSNNYVIIDTAVNSKGYWIRYPNSELIGVTGRRVESLSVPVQSGWNLIGIYDRDVSVNQLTTTPSSILTSLFYGFNSNYQTPTVLESGKGYWIRSSSNGVINLNTNKFAKETEENIVNANWPKIIVKDKLNNEGTLFVSENNVNLSIFDLPPVPPQGIFDVRYSSQRMVENLSNAKIIEVNSGTHPLKIKATGGSFKLKDIISGEFLNLILQNEEEVIIDNSAITKFQIESLEIPLEFRLNQNYPNPFNPSTMITYQIPVSGNVTLKIFDILGREVRTLVNERQEAGSYSVDFNVKALSSGTYFYKITADNFSQVKKMVVLK